MSVASQPTEPRNQEGLLAQAEVSCGWFLGRAKAAALHSFRCCGEVASSRTTETVARFRSRRTEGASDTSSVPEAATWTASWATRQTFEGPERVGKTWPDPELAGRTGYEAAPAVRCLTVVGPAWGESVERIPPREESLTKNEGKLIQFIQLSALQKKMVKKENLLF